MDQFVGEIRAFAFNFVPKGWVACEGQLLPISQHTALFSLLRTNFGGDGKSTFALPDLRGRMALHYGEGPGLSYYGHGQTGGTAEVRLEHWHLPPHSHVARAFDGVGTETTADRRTWATPRYGRTVEKSYSATGGRPMSSEALAFTGEGVPHNNMPPYLTLRFCIALVGIFPPRS